MNQEPIETSNNSPTDEFFELVGTEKLPNRFKKNMTFYEILENFIKNWHNTLSKLDD